MRFLLLTFCAVIACVQCKQETKPAISKEVNINTTQAASLAKEGYILIDLRTKGEIAEHGTIEGSLNIDFRAPDFKEQVSKLSKNEKYVLYCRSGGRSSNALSTFADQGLDAYNMLGGYTEWAKSKN